MKRLSPALMFFISALCTAVLLHCQGPVGVAGMGGSEVVGKLVTKDKKPATGAKVSVYINTFDTTKKAFRVASTDKNGDYKVVLDTTGKFFIYASYNKNDTLLVAYIPDISVDSVARPKEAPYKYHDKTDMLLPPGSVSGRVTVYSGVNGLILVDIPALSYQAHTDDSGKFKISNIPPGKYVIRYSKDNFLPFTSDSITVVSGRTTVLDSIELELDTNMPIPAPLGLTATPDPSSGTVLIRWNSVPYPNIYAYNLSRNKNGEVLIDSILAVIIPSTTVYIDTVYRSISDTLPKTIHYSIESIDINSKHSLTATSVSVSVIPPVKPGTVAIVSADSTDSSVTVRWNRFPENNFQSYQLHVRLVGRSVDSIITKTDVADTVCTIRTLINGSVRFSVQVVNAQGVASAPSLPRVVSIINTPPMFITDSSSLPDSASVGTEYAFALEASDKNADTLFYPSVTPAGAAVRNALFVWTPSLAQRGLQRFSVVASDSFGGLDTVVKNVYVVADKWIPGTKLNLPRQQFGVATVGNQIFAIGGQGKSSVTSAEGPLASVVSCDSASQWTLTTAMKYQRIAPMVAAWKDKIYAIGGYNYSATASYVTCVEEYSPLTGSSWQVIDTTPFERFSGAVCVKGDSLYCIGGSKIVTIDGLKTGIAVKSIDIFNLVTRVWYKGPNMHYSRAFHNAVVYNGKIYIAGGAGGLVDSARADSAVLNTVEVYDPASNKCTELATQPLSPRCQFGMAAIGSKVYLVGGLSEFTSQNGVLSTVERLDILTGAVDNAADLSTPRCNAQTIQINGRIYCVGGADVDYKSINDVLIYYP